MYAKLQVFYERVKFQQMKILSFVYNYEIIFKMLINIFYLKLFVTFII